VLTTDQKGAIAEAAITCTASKLGFDVYRPVAEGGRYDLILEGNSKLLRVQCKWATLSRGAVVIRCYSCRRGRDGMIVRAYTVDEIDVIAAYCMETNCSYLLSPDVFAARRVVHLRVSPSKNSQRLGINWADDFGLEARLTALLGP
jgi:PD-(D/E)XK endonuclease